MPTTQKNKHKRRGVDTRSDFEEKPQLHRIEEDSLSLEKKSDLHLAKKNTKKKLKKKKHELLEVQNRLRDVSQTLDTRTATRKEMVDECKLARTKLLKISAEVGEAHERIQETHSMLRNVLPRNEVIGLHALNRIVREEGVICGMQYFGTIIGNITLLDTRFYKAVEAAAKGALFHVVVDTKDTAMKLIKRLEKDGCGKVTFLPLDQLNSNSTNKNNIAVNCPDTKDSQNVVPLLEKCIKYNPKLEKAMRHVFGNKLFAESTKAATSSEWSTRYWSTKYHMDVVTIDGDLCHYEGFMSSNNVDTSISVFDTFHALNGAIEMFSRLTGQEKEAKEKSEEIETKIVVILRHIQELGAQKANLEDELERISKIIDTLKTRLDGIRKNLRSLKV
mmetsp:Transcript_8247/g.12427  ORF Transcript_8247/g.12427 Transcript_8247/m.12427 type:complete len:390 (+) Transcript_8247:49-1218(+)